MGPAGPLLSASTSLCGRRGWDAVDPWLLLYAGVLATLTAVAWAGRTSAFDPLAGFLAMSWLLVAVCLSGLIAYPRILSRDSCVLLSAGTAAFVAGSLLSRKARQPVAGPHGAPAQRWWVGYAIAAVGVLFSLALLRTLVPLLASGALSFGNLETLRRQTYAQNFQRGYGPIALLFDVTGGAIFLLAILLPLAKRVPPRIAVFTASLFCAAVVLLQALQSAGRYLVMAAAVASTYLWARHRVRDLDRPTLGALSSRLSFATKASLVGGVAILAFAMLVVFPSVRDPGTAANPEEALITTARRSFGPTTAGLEDLGLGNARQVAYSLSYFTDPFVMLTVNVETYGIGDDPMHGGYATPVVSDVKAALSGTRSDFWDARESLARQGQAYGYQPNPWASGYRDLILDYGRLGMVPAAFALGFLLGRCHHRSLARGDPFSLALAALAFVCATLFPLHSPFVLRPILYAVLVCAAICLLGARPLRRTQPT